MEICVINIEIEKQIVVITKCIRMKIVVFYHKKWRRIRIHRNYLSNNI